MNLQGGGALVVSKDPAAQQLNASSSATGDVTYAYAGNQTWCAQWQLAPCSACFALLQGG